MLFSSFKPIQPRKHVLSHIRRLELHICNTYIIQSARKSKLTRFFISTKTTFRRNISGIFNIHLLHLTLHLQHHITINRTRKLIRTFYIAHTFNITPL
ncbi:hypothetical protein HanRHA438_Chr13g0597241 [Helianthus annuus]|nr:hypothetical protein HanRHA438_Chr13g0597241 [Helianthus annuus]